MEASIAIFFGSTTGSTQMVAEKIRDLLGERLSHLADVNTAEASELEQYDVIFFGVPTWNVGEMQDDWADFIPNMSELNLAGKKVAFFGVGDAVGYAENFLDAMGELWAAVYAQGAPTLVGVWPTDGYVFEASKGLYADNHFLGVGLAEDNESHLTDERLDLWLAQVLQELALVEAAGEAVDEAVAQ